MVFLKIIYPKSESTFMENIESEFLKRHNLKIKEVGSNQIVKKNRGGKILKFPKKGIWNSEKIRKLYEVLFFQ
ncbi:hypothetical protein BWD12_02730 [Leptospira santarosai serovar Bananal]|uniref:Uncharacterized protein n=1 Tax=Leptospira santarosai TaxID=28183 RepID=A0AB73NEM3_9LEPT|nr:Uncharacterized protein XB17_00226 [Leptospira santarosai]OLY62342.1 hypothetical protein BV917_00085 [Leptospira santarosai serovar Guaricura]OLY65625.1 hypothetical protein BWD11_03775 [Leptospira santarosai serovar Grippotyphosa]ONF81079.1 hypothetical protein BWD12_02730 [Leptospira santarosai serovar Bananal]AVV78281.1 Uncharacterized protein XB15_00481 [Leptospira santarosai]